MTESWHADDTPGIARFECDTAAILAPDGSINRQLPRFASDTRLLVQVFIRAMVLGARLRPEKLWRCSAPAGSEPMPHRLARRRCRLARPAPCVTRTFCSLPYRDNPA